MKHYLLFATLIPLIVIHHTYTKDTCSIETPKLAKSCPEHFEFTHDENCYPIRWPNLDKEFWCLEPFGNRSPSVEHAKEKCVKYEFSEYWNEKNELIKTRIPKYAPVNSRVYIERKLSKNGEFGDILFLVIALVCFCFVVPMATATGAGHILWAIFIPAYFLREFYIWTFPLCISK